MSYQELYTLIYYYNLFYIFIVTIPGNFYLFDVYLSYQFISELLDKHIELFGPLMPLLGAKVRHLEDKGKN